MTDQQEFSSAAEQKADELLRKVFNPPEALAGDFENRVMSRVQKQARKSGNRGMVLMVMTAYWIAASLAGSWLWFEKSGFGNGQSSLAIIVLMIVLSILGLGVLFLVRQSSFKLSDLFLDTLR